MRKITQQIVGAFNWHNAAKLGNTESTGDALYLHGNKIAEWRKDGLYITNAGWSSNTTKERLNGLRGVSIYQKNFTWYLNGQEWGGGWINVSTMKQTPSTPGTDEGDPGDSLRTVGVVAMMGDIFGQTIEQKNAWKKRMLKAGIGEALDFPDDFDSLPEEEKARRLDGAIQQIVPAKITKEEVTHHD